MSAGTPAAVGTNLLLTCTVPYFVATGLQDTHLKLGLIIATIWSGTHLVLCGLLAFTTGHRKVFPYILEVVQTLLFAILLGVAYSSQYANDVITLNFNFIVLATLSGTAAVSMLVGYPLGLQHVQELLPWVYSRHDAVLRLGFHTTSIFCAASTTACLLYLVPVCKGVAGDHFNVLNLIFRIILPCVLMGLAVIVMRVWPDLMLGYLRAQDCGPEAMWWKHPVMYGTPTVLDNAMFAPAPKAALTPYQLPNTTAVASPYAPGQPNTHLKQQYVMTCQPNGGYAGGGAVPIQQGVQQCPQPAAQACQLPPAPARCSPQQSPPTCTPLQPIPQTLPSAAAYAPVASGLQARPQSSLSSTGSSTYSNAYSSLTTSPSTGVISGNMQGSLGTGSAVPAGGAVPWAGNVQYAPPPAVGLGMIPSQNGGPAYVENISAKVSMVETVTRAAPAPILQQAGAAGRALPLSPLPAAPPQLQRGQQQNTGIKAYYPGV